MKRSDYTGYRSNRTDDPYTPLEATPNLPPKASRGGFSRLNPSFLKKKKTDLMHQSQPPIPQHAQTQPKRSFSSFFGIDQTGAVHSNGRPHPLKAVFWWKEAQFERLVPIQLESLTRACLEKWIHTLGHPLPLSQVGILLDSVLGLPEACSPHGLTFEELIHPAKNYHYENKAYGQLTSFHFFERFWSPKPGAHPTPHYPKRRCEVLARANSVFQRHPFQKNIGCGTYRSWKDLAQDSSWFQTILDQPEKLSKDALESQPKAWIFEIYPSLFWQELGFSKRSPKEISSAFSLRKNLIIAPSDLPLLEEPNTADAAISVLGALLLQEQNRFWNFPQDPWIRTEGWILGLRPPASRVHPLKA
ncbi:MAG: hypothetical protein ACO3A2_01215 [Bdellovibrionia bacterium]